MEGIRPVVITTCVGYDDYLRHTLPHTLRFAREVFLVTEAGDPAAEAAGDLDDPRAAGAEADPRAAVTVLITDAFRRDSASFNKSAALREAQDIAHAKYPDAWILLLDADIVVDPEIGHGVDDVTALYGITRLDYATPEAWARGDGAPYHTPGAGYFQLYHASSGRVYPSSSPDASECDMAFYRSFSRHVLLGGAVAHLGTHTVNWQGRVSPPWQ